MGWALAGTLVVGVGAGTATYAAFQPALPLVGRPPAAVRVGVVAAGFALFFAGYRLSQVGTYRDGGGSLVESLRPAVGLRSGAAELRPWAVAPRPGSVAPRPGSVDAGRAVRAGFVVLGVVGLAAGMVLFAETIRTWDPYSGLLAGLVSFGGYVAGHVGLNSSLT